MEDKYITSGRIEKRASDNKWVLKLTLSVSRDGAAPVPVSSSEQPADIVLDELVVVEAPTWYPNNNA